MADLSNSSAAAVVDGVASKKELQKPEKPNEEAFQAALKKAIKEHADAQAKFNAIKAKTDNAQPNSKDSPLAKRRTELINQIKEIKEQQGAGKTGRNQILDQIKKLDEQLKSRIAEHKLARSRVSHKSADEVDREIDRLDKQVGSGMMKLVDEKKALDEISNLRKKRKAFAGFDEAQKAIDETKAKIKTLRDSLDDPESKALSDRYNVIQTELDEIKKEQDDAFKNINSLRDERTRLHNEQQEKYTAIKKLKDDHYQQSRAVQKYEYEARQRLRERRKAEQEAFEKEKRKERAQKLLAEASDKAYLDEIRRAESLLRFLDPSYTSEKAPLQAPSQFQAHAQRTVDDSALKGTRLARKDEREDDYFAGTGGKKGKKGRKGAAAAATNNENVSPNPAKYSCPPSVMEDCAFLGVEPPMSASDIPSLREKVKAKLDHWKADQDAQTEKNIAKAQKEVERLDAEDAAANAAPSPSSTPATPITTTNGDADHSSKKATEVEPSKNPAVDATDNVAADLKRASLEDKE